MGSGCHSRVPTAQGRAYLKKRLSLTLTLTPVFQGMRVHKVPGVETGKQVLRQVLRQLPPIRPSLPPPSSPY